MTPDTCTDGLVASASETMAHKLTQADKSQSMGTRTESFRTLSTILSEPVRSDPQHLYALGASWPRRRQTSRQYQTSDMQTHTPTPQYVYVYVYIPSICIHTHVPTPNASVPSFPSSDQRQADKLAFLVRHQGCFWSAHVSAMFMFGLGPHGRGP